MLRALYQMDVLKRVPIVWVAFMAILWGTFGVVTLASPEAYEGIIPSTGTSPISASRLLVYIIVMNGIVMLLIAGGNIFVRFGWVTPGLIVLLLQAVQIGWIAGSNGFETPFPSIAAANLAFLRVGLWETSAYALICAVTLTKSLLISDTFPARTWTQMHKLSDLKFSREEILVFTVAVVMWLGAAISETLLLV